MLARLIGTILLSALAATALHGNSLPEPLAAIEGFANGLALHPKKPILVLTTGEELKVFDLEEEKAVHVAPLKHVHPHPTFSPDGKWLVAASTKGPRVFDTETWESRTLESDLKRFAVRFHFNDEGTRLFVAPLPRQDAQIFETKGWTKIDELTPPPRKRTNKKQLPYTSSAALHPAGDLFVAMGERVHIWKKRKEKWKLVGWERRAPKPHDGGAGHLRFAPSGRHFAFIEEGGTVQIRSSKNLKTLTEFHTFRRGVRDARWSANSKFLIGTFEDSVRIWNVETEKMVAHYVERREKASPYALAIRPDGKWIAVGLGIDTMVFKTSDLISGGRSNQASEKNRISP